VARKIRTFGLTSALFAASWRARQQQKSQPRNAAGEIFVVARAKRTRTFVSAACGTQEMPANWRQKAQRQKLLWNQYVNWLGRQDSNLGMAESKSDRFAFPIKARSEKPTKVWL
jgi:hypothetical protein